MEGRTAGPSASLGMTKLRAGFPVRLCEVDGKIATLNFVIPSEAKGPAVRPSM
jgi:hypothetical protein